MHHALCRGHPPSKFETPAYTFQSNGGNTAPVYFSQMLLTLNPHLLSHAIQGIVTTLPMSGLVLDCNHFPARSAAPLSLRLPYLDSWWWHTTQLPAYSLLHAHNGSTLTKHSQF